MRITHGILALGLISLTQPCFSLDNDNIRVIVKYKKPPATLQSLRHQAGQTAQLPIQSQTPMAGGAYNLTFDSQALRSMLPTNDDPTTFILKRLKSDPNVVYAVKDRKGYFKPLPEAPGELKPPRISHEAQWDEFTRPGGIMLESAPGLHDGAWAYTTGQAASPIVVAVLDTGIAFHDHLNRNLIKDEDGKIWGWNFAANNDDLTDETQSYHGTHVAGTIAGYGAAMTGIGEDLKILPVKIPGKNGMFYESAVINAIRWSVGDHIPGVPDNPHPAKVLNMSFGVDEEPGKEIDHCDEALQSALSFAREQGAVVVAAAGNDNRWEHYNAPAVCNGTIKVASTGPQGLRAYYSNYGPSVTFAAPGGDLSSQNPEDGILSTVNPTGGYNGTGFSFYQGTSMASPHVAGVAGLVFAAGNDSLSPQQVEQILYTTTHAFGESDNANQSCIDEKPCGHGILDAENAIKATVARFDEVFTAPAPEKNNLAQGIVSDHNQHWIPVKAATIPLRQANTARLWRDKAGKIYAISATKAYQLDDKAYQSCQIIGFDGVGCYR